MTFKLASHSEPPIQPTCQSAAIASVGTAALYGPWVEGPLAWAAYFGGNALGILYMAWQSASRNIWLLRIVDE